MNNNNAKATTYHTNTNAIVANWLNSNERKAFYNDLIARAEMRNLTIPIYEGYLDTILTNIFKFVGIKSCDDLYLKGLSKGLENVKDAWMKIVESEFGMMWDFDSGMVKQDFTHRLYGFIAA